MQQVQHFTVIDSRLQAGRGTEFSATAQKEAKEREHEQQAYNDADPWHLPIGHRAEDSLDTEGLTMASVNTAIPENNKGFQMLRNMGWKGRGLGRNETGIVEPVKSGVEAGLRLGVGKQEQENFYMDADNVNRKKLEVELQAEEDEERRDKREMQAERTERIRQDVSTIQKSFYCETCNKQYKNAFEMEAHISSYDHHHRKRLIEMRSDEAQRTRGIRDKKEKKRAGKEMARLQAQIQAAQAAAAPKPVEDPPMPPALPPLPLEEEEPPPPPPSDPAAPPPQQLYLSAGVGAEHQHAGASDSYHQTHPESHAQTHGQLHHQSGSRSHAQSHHQLPYKATSRLDQQRHQQQQQQPPFHQQQQQHAVVNASSRQAVALRHQQSAQQQNVQVKMEPRLGSGGVSFTSKAGVKGTYVKGTPATGVPVKQEPLSSGGLQFGFGPKSVAPGRANTVANSQLGSAKRKPGLTAKPAIAAFNMADSDDEA